MQLFTQFLDTAVQLVWQIPFLSELNFDPVNAEEDILCKVLSLAMASLRLNSPLRNLLYQSLRIVLVHLY